MKGRVWKSPLEIAKVVVGWAAGAVGKQLDFFLFVIALCFYCTKQTLGTVRGKSQPGWNKSGFTNRISSCVSWGWVLSSATVHFKAQQLIQRSNQYIPLSWQCCSTTLPIWTWTFQNEVHNPLAPCIMPGFTAGACASTNAVIHAG